jgi:hypothetical protein
MDASNSGRLVVLGAAGGEGATTVARLLAAAMTAEGRLAAVVSRLDDPSRGPAVAAPAAVITDPGPHGADETAQPGDLAIFVCAATTAAIERGRRLLAEEQAQDRRAAALVISARTAAEGRRARVRMDQATKAKPRVVLLPFDAALTSDSLSPEDLSAATRDAVARLLALLQG